MVSTSQCHANATLYAIAKAVLKQCYARAKAVLRKCYAMLLRCYRDASVH